MNIRNLAVACAAIAMLVPAAASAQTESVSFSIDNKTDKIIAMVYYGHAADSEWSDDILSGVIEPGETLEVTVDDDTSDCMYDFMYTFEDGSDFVERVNMCEINGETFEFTGG